MSVVHRFSTKDGLTLIFTIPCPRTTRFGHGTVETEGSSPPSFTRRGRRV